MFPKKVPNIIKSLILFMLFSFFFYFIFRNYGDL